MGMEIIPRTNSLGAEICGVDLSRNPGDSCFADIHQAFLKYQVIYFREQNLSHQQYIDWASKFGALKEYLFADGIDGFPMITEIVKTETETESFGSFWHSDSTYMEIPPSITMLLARQVPALGGDTLFADMYAVYRDLSDGMKTALGQLRAINSASIYPRNEDIFAEVKSKNADKAKQQAIHPVIRCHDQTGRKSIYVNGIHTLCFDGMSREESQPILQYLYQQMTRPEYCFRLNWQKNTLAFWDNRCTQHYAINDYHGHRRVMHRIIVDGTAVV